MDNNEKLQLVSLKNRKELSISGVIHIIGFDSEYVSLETNMGRMTVEGKNIVIDSLSKNEGEVSILGEISGIFYSLLKEKNKGLFSGFVK